MKDRKDYFKEYHRKWYKEVMRPRRVEFFKNKKCEWCGSVDNLGLHHLDSSQKLGHNIWSWSEEKRNAEISKCIVLCKKCHHDYHNGLRIKHGLARYKKGCRCDICKKAKSIENAKRIRKKAAS